MIVSTVEFAHLVHRANHDCEYVGCRDQYDSFAPYRVMPVWPGGKLKRPGPPATPGKVYRDWYWDY